MSLTLPTSKTFKTRVDVIFPDGSAGDFVAEFLYTPRADLDALMAEKLPDAQFVSRVLKGTSGINDTDGNPLEFSAALPAIQGDVALCTATVRRFFETIGGAAEKNSKTSPAR